MQGRIINHGRPVSSSANHKLRASSLFKCKSYTMGVKSLKKCSRRALGSSTFIDLSNHHLLISGSSYFAPNNSDAISRFLFLLCGITSSHVV